MTANDAARTVSTITNYALTAEQQLALLELISYALQSADSDLECNTTGDTFDPANWDPHEDLAWLKHLPSIMAALDSIHEEIDIAKDLAGRLERLKTVEHAQG